jgi:hypothetical protein
MGGLLDVLDSGRKRLRRGTRAFNHEVEINGARIFVDHGFQWVWSRNVWLTRARACFVLGSGPRFRLRPRNLFERLVGWYAGRPSGDPCIDDFFAAYATHEEATETWSALTTRARSLLVRSFDDAQLVSDGRMVVLWREGDFGREADAAAAAELVADIAGFRAPLFERLRNLPGAVYRPATGDWDRREPATIQLALPEPVTLKTTSGPRGAVLASSAACGCAVEPFSVDFDDPKNESGGALRLDARRLTADGETVELVWRDLDVDRERVLAGARWVAKLAAGRRALYR